MSRGEEIFRTLQAQARAATAAHAGPTPTQEYLTRHILESFIDRLSRTEHGEDFILKGGVLLAAYGARRPTKDADMNAISAQVSPAHLHTVVCDLASHPADDGVSFDPRSTAVREIRNHAEYPGFRVRVAATIGPWHGVSTWDVSTGDPIIPPPRLLEIQRLIGDPIRLLGYPAETMIAEKGVTILERGVTSTRWRDYVDIVQLCRQGFNAADLRRAAESVARYRGVELEAVSSYLDGAGQPARPNGPHGAGNTVSKTCQKPVSKIRQHSSPPISIRCSPIQIITQTVSESIGRTVGYSSEVRRPAPATGVTLVL